MRGAAALAVAASITTPAAGAAERPEALLERHRPELVYDGAERWRAVAVDEFLRDGLPPRLSDSPTSPAVGDVVYGRVVRSGSRTWLQYWLFFAYNGQDRGVVRTGRHEGDWELFQVRFGRGGMQAATFTQHSSAAGCAWDELERSPEGAPRVYVANASHALYPRAGVGDRPFPDPNDEARGGGRVTRPEVRVVTASAPAWMRWGGRWGRSEGGLVPGEQPSPWGPASAGERWSDPARLHRGARDCLSAPGGLWSAAPWLAAALIVTGFALIALRRRRAATPRSVGSDSRGVKEEGARRASAPKRIAFAALLTIVGVNVWTGGPLLALWVGSRVQGSGPPTMGAVFVVVVVLAAVCLVLATAFARLNEAYQEMTGQAPTVRHHTPWLRSMRGERPQYQGVEPTLTTPERILVVMVVTAFVLFEIWFFFFSASPIDNRSGRAALAPAPAAAALASVSLATDGRRA